MEYLCKDSASRAQWQKNSLLIFLALPRRSLSYQKIVQVERNDKKNRLLIFLALPRRSQP